MVSGILSDPLPYLSTLSLSGLSLSPPCFCTHHSVLAFCPQLTRVFNTKHLSDPVTLILAITQWLPGHTYNTAGCIFSYCPDAHSQRAGAACSQTTKVAQVAGTPLAASRCWEAFVVKRINLGFQARFLLKIHPIFFPRSPRFYQSVWALSGYSTGILSSTHVLSQALSLEGHSYYFYVLKYFSRPSSDAGFQVFSDFSTEIIYLC